MDYENWRGGEVAPQVSGGGDFWTYEALQERWVETVLLYDRLPDQERGWLTVRAFWPEILQHGWRVGVDGEHDERAADEAPEPAPLPLTRAQVAQMTEAAEWLLLVPEADRRVVALGLRYLARGHKRISWTRMLKQLGLKRGAGSLRMRYERAVAVATLRLNGMPEAQALAMARRSREVTREA